MVTTAALLLLTACEEASVQGMVGTLERNRIELAFESNEPIAIIHVADGQWVKAGTLLIEQDAERMEVQHERLEGERERVAARLAELERGPREESIREARALLESAQAETINAKAELDRIQGVFDKGLSTQEALDRANTRYSTAGSMESARRESLGALLNGTTIEELQQAAAALKSATAAVEEARLAVDRTKLHAPVDGRVDKVLARLGERPLQGETVAIMLDDNRTYARIYVPENLKSTIKADSRLNVSIDGQAQPYEGTVRWVSSDASFTPYFALTEHDRSRLSYIAEVDLPAASELPVGVPLVALPPTGASGQ
ncbi:MAG TPA: HlyD family efflux transporter periplasmic adaptor subunit [Xanthomonadales bacterium]|nr:HlyD family efflux transporter periplasmic adaptor subunit [Xanthomonadales bacterium]